MPRRAALWLTLIVPLAVAAGVVAAAALPLHSPPAIRIELPPAGTPVNLPKVLGPADSTRPLVVIDAGHGGHDPGASGQGQVEKDLVLGLATALRDRLVAEGGIRVALTRSDDRFLALGERFAIARDLGADLFLSIHADSAGDKDEPAGATIYTLSERASSEAAARLAARENAVDQVNGVALSDQSDAVNAILVDLSQSRAQADSAEFARLIAREGEGLIAFHPEPRRSAALAVLRAPDVPSVLYEAGYITNAADAQRLASAEGRARFAEVLARAIRIYFARASAGP